MEQSKIEWTDNTWNPWWGCMKVSDGCKNCYAETLDNRYHKDAPHWGPGSSRKPQSDKYWQQPLKWNAEAEKAGKQAKVFCASMADVFEGHPDTIEHRQRLFRLIEQTPFLIWQLLTKRPENILALNMVPDRWRTSGFPPNVWIGTSVENQKAADERIPHLMRVPAAVRFLSCEPLLGPVRLDFHIRESDGHAYVDNPLTGWRAHTCGGSYGNKIDWVICGGESGHGARPMHPDWARSLRDQCAVAGVPFFFKQHGEWWPGEKGRLYREHTTDFTDGQPMVKLGKGKSGRLLDGQEHNEFPTTQTT